MVVTRPSSPVLVLQPGALTTGASYTLRLTATDAPTGAAAYAETSFSAAAAPRGLSGPTGSLLVTPVSPPLSTTPASANSSSVDGVAFTTRFEFAAVGWAEEPDSGPLLYQLRTAPAIPPSPSSPPLQWTVLSDFKPQQTVAAALPPGYPLPEGGPLLVQLCARSPLATRPSTTPRAPCCASLISLKTEYQHTDDFALGVENHAGWS